MIRLTTVDSLSGVADAAEQRELSDGLGVSSALYLGAADMLKLKAVLEAPNDAAHAQRVLRRLSMVPMTMQLDTTTGFLAFMVELSTDETVQATVQAGAEEAVQAASLITRILSTWEARSSGRSVNSAGCACAAAAGCDCWPDCTQETAKGPTLCSVSGPESSTYMQVKLTCRYDNRI